MAQRINFTKAARQGILDLEPYVPGKPIDEVKREFGLEQVTKLASNECPRPLPDVVYQAAAQAMRHANRYPDGGAFELSRAVAAKWGFAPENLLFGNGAEEVIRYVAQAFINQGENSVIPDPSFDAYITATVMCGAEARLVPLKGHDIDLGAMLEAVDASTKMIWLCTPNNPTTTVLKAADVDAFLQQVPDDVLVFLDEAYYEFVDDPDRATLTPAHLADGRVIGLRTFSKAFGIAGLRAGYMIAHPDAVKVVEQIKLPFNVSVPAQAAALAALGSDEADAVWRGNVKRVRAERTRFAQELDKNGWQTIPSQTNFLFTKMPDSAPDSGLVFGKLLKKGYIVRPGSAWNMPRYLRISLGEPEENDGLLAAFNELL